MFYVYLNNDPSVKKPFVVITNPDDAYGPCTTKVHANKLIGWASYKGVNYAYLYLPDGKGSLTHIVDRAIEYHVTNYNKGKLVLTHKKDRKYFILASSEICRALDTVAGLKEKVDQLLLTKFNAMRATALLIKQKRDKCTHV